jgi:hypothetical protein
LTIRVVQWTTGNVAGKQSAIAIARNPGLELVGCYAWSPDKVGRDVGELCGVDPVGVTATDDVDALLALRPNCVVYNPMWPSIDELVRILGAGVNVVTTAAFINGRRLGADRERLVEACERGGASLFGTGSVRGSASCSASWSRASAIGSTSSRSARRPTRWATTRPPRRSRPGSVGRSTTPIFRR